MTTMIYTFPPNIAQAPGDVEGNPQTGTSYTLTLDDLGKVVSMDNASANTLIIPANSSVAFEVGATISVLMLGTGTTTIETAAAGIELNGSAPGSVDIIAQYQGAVLRQVAIDQWVATGAII